MAAAAAFPAAAMAIGGADAAAPSRFEAGVLAELNRFRADPPAYARVLGTYRPRFTGKRLRGAEKGEIDIMTV